MSSDRWHQAWDLFQEALELPAAEREPFLSAEAGDDEELLRAVSHWLEADREATGFLETDALQWSSIAPLDLTGRQIGAYQVREEIGRGGMGTVYRAHQKDEIFDREVALKVLTTAPFGVEARRRFDFERRALASLDHPFIARVFDGGTTDENIPFLVLEFIPGQEIDQYCEAQDLTVRERVSLFQQVCHAVAAAHRELIVHRDLKPSNILVREDGQPKLLDFGIAKLLSAEVEAASTVSWSRPLTPRYASPEQIRGERASVRTDVFSLGVLLYKLLCGSLPFSCGSEDLNELLREIERGPRVPSSRVSGVSSLSRQLQGDLDSIVLKALRPELSERYASVEQLDDDLERFLTSRPVRARRGSRRYRLGKLLHRNRWPVGLAATLVIGLGVLVTVLWLANTRLAMERAEQDAVRDFFLGVFERADPFVSEVADETVKQAIDRSAERLETGLQAQPGVRAALAAVLGDIYLELGDSESALSWSEEALDLHTTLEGPDSSVVAESLGRVGASLRGLERLDEALATSSASLEQLRKVPGVSSRQLIRGLNHLVGVYCARDELSLAGPLAKEALERARGDLAPSDPESITALLMHAVVLGMTNDAAGAIQHYEQARALLEGSGGGRHPDLPALHQNLARQLHLQGDYAEAQRHLEAADRLYQELAGKDYFERAKPLNALGQYARRAGDTQRARELYGEAVRIGRLSTTPMHIVKPVPAFADLLIHQGECERAEAEIRASLARLPDSSERLLRTAVAECFLGASLACQGRFTEAKPILLQTLDEMTAAEARFPATCRDALTESSAAARVR